MTRVQIEAQRVSGLSHSPAQFRSRRAWARIPDRKLIEFAITKFDVHGRCTMPIDELYHRRFRPTLEAMLYHNHARFSSDGFYLIGTMRDVRLAVYWRKEFGLVLLTQQPPPLHASI